MKTQVIYKNKVLTGKIIKRESYHLKVQLEDPIRYCPAQFYISGMCRANLSFLSSEGEKSIARLLIESYRRAEILHQDLDGTTRLYKDLLNEQKSIEHIPDIEIRKTISSKLEDWFFDCLFSSLVTGLGAPYDQREYIFKLLDEYLAFSYRYNEHFKN